MNVDFGVSRAVDVWFSNQYLYFSSFFLEGGGAKQYCKTYELQNFLFRILGVIINLSPFRIILRLSLHIFIKHFTSKFSTQLFSIHPIPCDLISYPQTQI